MKTILVVEDDELTSMRLVRLLESQFVVCPVFKFSDIDCSGNYDAAVLDLNLPDSLGIETLKSFRKSMPEVPVVVVTGLIDIKDEALKEGADSLIEKMDLTKDNLIFALTQAIAKLRTDKTVGPVEKTTQELITDVRQLKKSIRESRSDGK